VLWGLGRLLGDCFVFGGIALLFIHLFVQLPVGLNLRMLVPRDSYISLELDATLEHFSAYGGYGYAVTTGVNIKYHDRGVC
jgi:hypothetical protein